MLLRYPRAFVPILSCFSSLVLRRLILKVSNISSSNKSPPKGMFEPVNAAGSLNVHLGWGGINVIFAKSCTVFSCDCNDSHLHFSDELLKPCYALVV